MVRRRAVGAVHVPPEFTDAPGAAFMRLRERHGDDDTYRRWAEWLDARRAWSWKHRVAVDAMSSYGLSPEIPPAYRWFLGEDGEVYGRNEWASYRRKWRTGLAEQ